MGRRIVYKIEDRGGNRFTEKEWAELERLQHWYNSEFSWSTGLLAFKRSVVFPNTGHASDAHGFTWDIIGDRRKALRLGGMPEYEIIAQMEKEGLLIVKWGGYCDECLASGFTRVADNEWNAFLVCDFLLKASTLFADCAIHVSDEGKFVKSGSVTLRDARVIVGRRVEAERSDPAALCRARSVFSVVDPEKYARHRSYINMIPEFNTLKVHERRKLVQHWNWLGYDGNFDYDGDDIRGFDLNLKVRSFDVQTSLDS